MADRNFEQRKKDLLARRAKLSTSQQALLEKRLQGSDQVETSVPIASVTRDGPLPLSPAQQRLWFLDQLEPGSAAYNISSAVRLQGTLNVAALERSLNEIIRRHETLRTTFARQAEQPVQVIAPAAWQALPCANLTELTPADREIRARQLIAEDAQCPFDLAQGPLLRSKLLCLDEREHILILTMHHIISDGWSMGVLVREMATLYQTFAVDRPSPLPELSIQYADYAAWQRQWLTGEVLEQQLSYWKQQLSGALPVLDLPTDQPRPPIQTLRGGMYHFQVAKDLTERLKTLSRQHDGTLFMTLLAAFQTLLHRYTGQTDLIVGAPIANRGRVETEGLIGFFVNTLALRVDLNGDPTFLQLLTRVREVTLNAYAHQDVPFDRLVEELHVPRDLSRTPLFQVMFVLQNAPMPVMDLPDLRLQAVEAETATAKFELTLSLIETAGGLLGNLEYNSDLFEAATISRLAEHYQNLLAGIVANPAQHVSELPLLSTAEWQQLITEWNQTTLAYPADLCLHQLFEVQATQTPEASAVVFNEQPLTYRELNERAEQLAQQLRRWGAGPEVLVGLCVERSIEMIIGLLGILKAGSAYVPLDPTYPPERLAFILEDTRSPILLTQASLLERLPQQTAHCFCLDRDWHTLAAVVEPPSVCVDAQNLAYLIYTSGSTGRPKGVAIPHRQAVAFIYWAQQHFARAYFDGVLAATSICFDLSIFEIFATLSCGGTIILAQNALQLSQLPAKERVTLINTVPSAIKELLRSDGIPDSVRVVNLAGEPLPQSVVEQLYQRPSIEHVFDLYGPSETTTYSTGGRRHAGGRATIGRPIGNTQIYLLDTRFQPVPIGVTGEVFIGGAGVTRGYLHRPELTAERYLPDPFSSQPGARLYRTGDLARYRPDGQIEFLGRGDYQVKVRGFRIELGEIEMRLQQHPDVQQALVVARTEADGDQRLVAYVVAAQHITVADLRQFLQITLPDYMLPAVFVMLPELPLTPNGKIDRRALPAPDPTAAARETYTAPRTPLEEELAAIWCDLLHLERVGVHDNFFELGGHSLLATQVMTRLTQRFQVTLPLQALFQSPTIATVAEKIEMIRWAAQDQASPTGSDQAAREEGEL